jgi:AcrR family transcriptional regulator
VSVTDWKARPEGPEFDAMRAKLVDAAEQIVRDDGVKALRLDAVAANVGVHRSSVYRYFNSKEEIVTAVVVQATIRIAAEVTAGLGDDAPPEKLLVEGIVNALAAIAQDPVHQSLMTPDSSEAMARIAGTALTSGIGPVIQPMFDAADDRGMLRAGVTPEDAIRWLQIVASGLMRTPNLIPEDELRALLHLMLVPSLIDPSSQA